MWPNSSDAKVVKSGKISFQPTLCHLSLDSHQDVVQKLFQAEGGRRRDKLKSPWLKMAALNEKNCSQWCDKKYIWYNLYNANELLVTSLKNPTSLCLSVCLSVRM